MHKNRKILYKVPSCPPFSGCQRIEYCKYRNYAKLLGIFQDTEAAFCYIFVNSPLSKASLHLYAISVVLVPSYTVTPGFLFSMIQFINSFTSFR